jgi:hypothetical protein
MLVSRSASRATQKFFPFKSKARRPKVLTRQGYPTRQLGTSDSLSIDSIHENLPHE